MEKRDASQLRYSIIRYTPDVVVGETLNVGLIMHSCNEEVQIRFEMLPTTSTKFKYYFQNIHLLHEYKSFSDMYNYYFANNNNLTGSVGDFALASTHSEEFLEEIYEKTKFSKFYFTKPKIARSSDLNRLFNSLYKTYVNSFNINEDVRKMTVRKHIKQLFIDKGVWESKIAKDKVITPIKDLSNFQVKIDYSFKNGVWNYLQTMPSESSHAKTVEWFAKTKMLVENLTDSGEIIHLVYHSNDFNNEQSKEILNYLENMNKDRVNKIDLNDPVKVNGLLNKVQNEAHDLSAVM